MGRLLSLHVGLQRFDQSILNPVGGLEGSVRVVRKLKDAVKSSLRLQLTPAAMNAPSQVVRGNEMQSWFVLRHLTSRGLPE